MNSLREWIEPLSGVRRRLWMIRLWHCVKWGFLIGLALGVCLLLLARVVPILYDIQGSLALFIVGGLVGFGIGLGRKPTWTEVIHHADQRLQLQESLITSWEKREQESPMILLQRKDALRKLHERLPTVKEKMQFHWGSFREVVIGSALLISMMVLVGLPNPLTEVARKQAFEKEIIKKEQERIAAQEERFKNNQHIDSKTKRELAKELNHLQKQLEKSSTLEQAAKEIAKSEERLKALAFQKQQENKGNQKLLQALKENDKLASLNQLIHESKDGNQLKKKSEEAFQKLTEQEKDQLLHRLRQSGQIGKIDKDNSSASELFREQVISTSQSIQQLQKNQESIREAEKLLQSSKDQMLAALQPDLRGLSVNQSNPQQSSQNQQTSNQPPPLQTNQNKRNDFHNRDNQNNNNQQLGAGDSRNGPQSGSQPSKNTRVFVPFSKIKGKENPDVVKGITQGGPEQKTEQLSTERGTSLPYSEVFASYQAEFREALDRGELPPEWQSIVRDYFSSIEP